MKQIPVLNPVLKDLNPLQQALREMRKALGFVFLFSCCANLLMLITPLYSLQVLDRVLGSQSIPTLVMLSLIIGLVFFVYGLIQVARSFTLIKIGEWLDNKVSPTLLKNAIAAAAIKPAMGGSQILRDFQTVKTFLTSAGLNAILDMPWTIMYIIALYLIHPYIGSIAVYGSIIISSFALLNAIATTRVLQEATEYNIKSLNQAEIGVRNAEVVEAMGMMNNITNNWHTLSKSALERQSIASYRSSVMTNIARFIRNIIGMSVTATSAMVIINTQEMTTGGMIASSILMGKALQPFDNAIELWKNITNSMKAYARINANIQSINLRDSGMIIPNIEGKLKIKNVYYAHAAKDALSFLINPKYTLQDVSFALNPGEILAIVGHSAAGKSTLAKLLVGVWKPLAGSLTLDGAEIYNWNRENFGTHVGYLPQGIELFSGSVKENIARMKSDFDPDSVIEAAKMAGAHDMILALPNGYDSDIGVAGSNLSGGQRQRVGLARAFYGNPKLVVLDEPNSNLDVSGEQALASSLLAAKEKGIAVIVISHRPSILSVVDRMMIMQGGKVLHQGTKEEVEAILRKTSA